MAFTNPIITSGFEGKITFVKQSVYDTSYYDCYIKGELIRIEEYDKQHHHQNTFIGNLKNQTLTAIDQENKLVAKIETHSLISADKNEFQTIKTTNHKLINGYECYQWRVKNKYRKTEISYWVTKIHFPLCSHFLKLLNSSENFLNFFLYIPDNDGFFPILVEERTILREEKVKLQVTHVSQTILSKGLFTIPKSYKIQNT
jgi:hypothetical protein